MSMLIDFIFYTDFVPKVQEGVRDMLLSGEI